MLIFWSLHVLFFNNKNLGYLHLHSAFSKNVNHHYVFILTELQIQRQIQLKLITQIATAGYQERVAHGYILTYR